MAKNTTPVKDPEGIESSQNTSDTENQGATLKEETPKGKGENKPKGKVYKFVSNNKFLTCSSVGVQFINGKAETRSLEVAKILATLSGVTLVEE